MSKPYYDILLDLYESGKTAGEIALLWGISESDVLSMLSEEGIDSSVDSSIDSSVASVGTVSSELESVFRSFDVEYQKDVLVNDVLCMYYVPKISLAIDIISIDADLVSSGIIQSSSIHAYELGVSKFFMFVSDWFDETKRNVFLTQLKYRLDNRLVIGARDCTVKCVSGMDARDFYDLYHFQGGVSNLRDTFALFYDDDIVSCLSIRPSRFESDCFEIVRYCPHPGFAISGGFAKLFKHSVQTFCSSGDKIVSYMDMNRRFSVHNIYERSGFSFDKYTVPDYFWSSKDGKTCFSRYEVTKKKLVAKGYSSKLTEKEIMQSLGFVQVFGAGSARYLFNV